MIRKSFLIQNSNQILNWFATQESEIFDLRQALIRGATGRIFDYHLGGGSSSLCYISEFFKMKMLACV